MVRASAASASSRSRQVRGRPCAATGRSAAVAQFGGERAGRRRCGGRRAAPSATVTSSVATDSASGTVRTEWSSATPASQIGYQIRSAIAVTAGPRCSRTRSRSPYGAHSRRPSPPVATSATPMTRESLTRSDRGGASVATAPASATAVLGVAIGYGAMSPAAPAIPRRPRRTGRSANRRAPPHAPRVRRRPPLLPP